MEKIQIKYFDKDIDKIEKISQGDLIDLRAAETVHMKAGEYKLIPLGVGMKLPAGYKANVYPRSSTYKNFGIILANSVGQIDGSYCGDSDQWRSRRLRCEIQRSIKMTVSASSKFRKYSR